MLDKIGHNNHQNGERSITVWTDGCNRDWGDSSVNRACSMRIWVWVHLGSTHSECVILVFLIGCKVGNQKERPCLKQGRPHSCDLHVCWHLDTWSGEELGGLGRAKNMIRVCCIKKNLKMSNRELSGWLSSHCVAEVCSLLSPEMGGSLSASGQEKRRVVCENNGNLVQEMQTCWFLPSFDCIRTEPRLCLVCTPVCTFCGVV